MRVWKLCLNIGMRVRMQMMCSIEMCARGHIKPGDIVAPSPIPLSRDGIAMKDSEFARAHLFAAPPACEDADKPLRD